jgi:hypothetical protein
MYVLLFDLCWVEVGVGNSKGISMCKDFLGNKLAYCVCLSHPSTLLLNPNPWKLSGCKLNIM